jgi:hypothetical protein
MKQSGFKPGQNPDKRDMSFGERDMGHNHNLLTASPAGQSA